MNFFSRYAPIINILKWAAVAALVIFCIVLWRNGNLQAAQIKAAEEKNAALEKQVAASEQEIAKIRANEKAANDALEAEKKKPATVKTVTKFIQLPGEIKVVQVPGQPDHIEITGPAQPNLDALQKFGIECQECKNSLLARNTELAEKDKQLSLRTQERDTWKAAAQGGTRWQRTKRELKCAAVGGAGAAGASFAPNNKAAWTFVGASVGELACHIFSK